MHSQNNVMIFTELREGKIAEVSLELLSKASDLAGVLGGEVEAVVLGHDIQEELEVLGHYGCARVYYVDDPRLAYFTSMPYAKTIAGLIRKYGPKVFLLGATTTGRDVAPRVASQLQCGLTADCTDLQIGNYKFKSEVFENILLQIRPAFGGNIIATIVSPRSHPSMATVREGVMRKKPADTDFTVEIIREKSPVEDSDVLTEILEIKRKKKSVDLRKAKIIVAAGMGAADAQSLELVQQLSSVLGGAVGASRPLIDSGLMDKAHQVGQTGTTVRPNLYIACGISGQIQHRAGMMESKRIIAVNNDPDAPIFDIAHYGIVGEVKDVLPKMIKAYKEKA